MIDTLSLNNISREEKEKIYLQLLEINYEKAYRNLYYFFKQIWHIIEPNTELLENWHQELICEYLTACKARQIKRLIINVPPRSLKSNLITVTYPCWTWLENPSERFMTTSYSYSLSMKHGDDRRTILKSDWYCNHHRKNFNIEKDTTQVVENNKRGHFIATSLQGTATGKGGNILIVDDPHDAQKASSEKIREKDIEIFNKKFTTRLDDKKNGIIIIVMQRLHEKDLTGYLLAEQNNYEHLVLPAVAQNKTIITFPISKKEIIREEGDLLHEERESFSDIELRKKELGSFEFAGQYLQAPSPREGGIIKLKYFRYYDKVNDTSYYDEIIDSWDCTFKGLATSDYVACTVWGKKDANRYLLYAYHAKIGFVDTIREMLRVRQLFPRINKTLIEDKANGTAIIEVLKSKIDGIIPYNPDTSKEGRLHVVEPQFEAGNIFLPVKSIATFDVEEYVDELIKFPTAPHDDYVDSSSMALMYLKENTQIGYISIDI